LKVTNEGKIKFLEKLFWLLKAF